MSGKAAAEAVKVVRKAEGPIVKTARAAAENARAAVTKMKAQPKWSGLDISAESCWCSA